VAWPGLACRTDVVESVEGVDDGSSIKSLQYRERVVYGKAFEDLVKKRANEATVFRYNPSHMKTRSFSLDSVLSASKKYSFSNSSD